MLGRVWSARWGRASAVAVLVAMWPACMGSPEDVPVETAGRVEYASFDFTLKDHTGADVNLADFKGRPVLINFWATWCAPCKVEMPDLVALQDKYRDTGFVVLGITFDDRVEDLPPFVEELKINYPILSAFDRNDVIDEYQAGFILPESWFVRRDGSVSLKHVGILTKDQFDAHIQAIVEDPAAEGTR